MTQYHVDTAGGRLVRHRMNDENAARLEAGRRVVLTWAPEHMAVLAGSPPSDGAADSA